MRRTILVLTIAISLLVARVPTRAEDLGFTFFGDYLESLRRQAGIPGLAAVIVGPSDVLWTRALGSQNVERAVAMRTDSPAQVDGLAELITASLVLRCTEYGSLSLSDRVGTFAPESADAAATIGQLLTHTSGSADGATFDYRPDKLQPLARAIESCSGQSFRATVAALLAQMAMMDSVPGADTFLQALPDPDIAVNDLARYPGVLDRLVTPYAVDRSG